MRSDVYERITGQIVAQLEKGVRPWMKPWDAAHARGRLLCGIVKLTDCRLFSAFFHEAKPLKLRKAAIDNLPRFWSESS